MRSGTTLLRLMLDHHPQVAWCSEFAFSVERIQRNGEWPRLSEYYRYLEITRPFQHAGYTINPELSYPDLVNSFLCQKRDRDGKQIVGATVHRFFDRLLWIWPSSRFIHLLRDGRDVARSFVALGWAGNAWGGTEHWIEAERLWERLRPTLRDGQYHEVRYESLIRAPDETLRQICEFIGVPYATQMLRYPQATTYAAPDPNLVDQWQRNLSAQAIRQVEARTGDMLPARGYALSDLPPLQLKRAAERWLRFQNRYLRACFRARRYGWPLFVCDFLARRLHLGFWQRRLLPRIHAVDTVKLK